MSTNRRDFLARMMQGATLATTGGLGWAYLLRQEVRAQPYALRPPGALPGDDFNALCIKCGQCVTACPFDTLKLAAAGGDLPIGMPYFEPRKIPCYLCPDIPCMKACPTGALSPKLKNINDSRMGLAVIDQESCLSYKGLRCEICHRECPIKGKAITLETHPRAISKHAMFIPLVHSDACTGCGICVKACPTTEPAIRILPHALVQGKIGEHYRLGWTRDDSITQEFDASAAAPTINAPSSAPAGPVKGDATDYLNAGGL